METHCRVRTLSVWRIEMTILCCRHDGLMTVEWCRSTTGPAPFALHGMSFYRIEGGRVRELWWVADALGPLSTISLDASCGSFDRTSNE
jgi:hypothetical protein